MKTSKRILSFFLAVVMVVTTCSVGLTAFAADNKTDSNNAYWNDTTDADEAFAAIENLVDTYVPMLLNIDGVKSALEGLGMTITEDTSVSDLIAGLSPTLMGLLGSSGDLSTIFEENNMKYTGLSKYLYSYLDGDEDDVMDFASLYVFCKDNQGADGELGEYCRKTFPILKNLLQEYNNAYNTYYAEYENGVGLLVGYLDEVMNSCDELTLDVLNSFELSDGRILGEITEEEGSCGIAYVNALYQGAGRTDISITTAAEACYYMMDMMIDMSFIETFYYLNLINLSGAEVFCDEASTTPITSVNYQEELSNYYSPDEINEQLKSIVVADENGNVYTGYLEDGTVYFKYGAFNSVYYNDILVGLMSSIGNDSFAFEVEDQKITDKQLELFIDYAQANFIDAVTGQPTPPQPKTVVDYLTTSSPFSSAVNDYLIKVVSADTTSYDITAWCKYAATPGMTPELLRTYGHNQHGMSDKVNNTYRLSDMTVVEELDYMIASTLILNEFGDSYRLDSMGNAVNVNNLYQTLVIEHMGLVEPNIENVYDYSDYPIPDSLAVETVNSMLNNLIGSFLNPDTQIGGIVNGAISGLLVTEVDLFTVLTDIWMRLYEAPVETIFELLPTLVVALDELLVPILFNAEGDKFHGFLYSLLCTGSGILRSMSQTDGDTSVGIGQLTIDLNTSLPAVLHWVTGDQQTALDIVGTYEGDIYDNSVPKFFNIYVLDKLIAGANLTNGSLDQTLIDGGMDATMAAGVVELIATVVTTAMGAVDAYLADHGDDVRGGIEGIDENETAHSGLNNLFVAIPQLMDYLVKAFLEKYEVDSDWTSCYDGKFVEVERIYAPSTGEVETWTEIQNTTLNNFKALAKNGEASDVLYLFVDALIGNWVNGLIDFVNDVVSDDSNKITKELPLVFNLLNALGGFGEKSIVSDLLNGLFQLKRSDAASFGLTEQETTGFVGFSNESGMFLISNLQFEADGEQRGLIPLIINLIGGDGQADYDISNAISSTDSASAASVTPYAEASVMMMARTSSSTSSILTAENIEIAETLVDTLDTLLASLLENTSLNGFTLNATDNLLSSVVSLAATAIGQDNASDLVKLLDNYVYYVVGESLATPNEDGKIGTQPKDGAVDADKIYTSANLSNLVIQTYSLIENIVDYLFYNTDSGLLKSDEDMLIADAIAGIISPDSVGVRMSDDYADTAEILAKDKYLNWNDFKVEITAVNEAGKDYKTTDYLKYGFSAGDKDEFYTALAESLGSITAILGAVLASPYGSDTSDSLYSTVLYPVLSNIAAANGVTAMAPAAFANADNASRLVDGLLRPLSETLACIYDAPISMLLNTITGLAAVLEDSSIKGIVGGVDGLVNGLLGGVENILNLITPNNKLGTNLLGSISINISVEGEDIVVNLINGLLGGVVELPTIDWAQLANAGSPAEALLLIFEYVVDFLLEEDGIIQTLIKNNAPELLELIKQLSAAEILAIINDVIQVTQSPTEIYWTFSQYAAKLTGSFSYPKGVTASDANKAITQLDTLVENIFPLLKDLGVLNVDSLAGLVNGSLYTNEILTTIAKALYGALNSNIADGLTIADILVAVGIDVTPAGVAAYLTDSTYGNTYSSAAATLKSVKSWNDVKTLNWGFTNGAANAQQGFINGLAAVLRPLNNLLAVFLVQGEIQFDGVNLAGVLSNLNIKISDTAVIENGVLTVTLKLNDPAANILKIDLGAIATDIDNLLKDGKLAMGTNGYESAIIPLLEALCCDGVKTYAQYQSDYAKAKDNLLINVLNPLFGFVGKVIDAPFDTLAGVLPNVALFIDGGGITQLVSNLLAPVTADDGLLGVLNNHGINVDELIAAIAGKDLGTILTDALGIKGVTLELKLTELEKSNLHDILIPLVNSLLKSTGIVLPNINWAQLASHGTLTETTSAARNSDGTFIRKQVVNVNKGETLIAVLRYIESVLVNNSTALKSLLGGLLGNNATVKNIVNSILTQIGTAKTDDLVRAIFYFLQEQATNDYFDYREFKYENYDFSWGSMDEDFCRQLAPMLDGLIGGLIDLNGLVVDNLYKDSIVSSLAVGLYKAVEGVKISDGLYLDDLLAKTGIDFTSANVAALLVNEDYGQTYEDAASVIKSAGSWANVNADNLKWGVTDRDSFLHALVAVLRPVYGVIDVLLNNGSLNLFNLISIPGSNAYTSAIVPLMEAFGLYNIKTQYQYREDIYNEYDAILLDILNPIIDKVEDLLAAPIQTLADILPNLSLFFANDGLIQFLENLLTPISALLNALRPIVDVNELLVALGLDIPKVLANIGINLGSDYKFDIYNLTDTLIPLVGAENVVGLLNGVLGIIEISGSKLGIVLPEINWYQLASHGEVITDGTSQAACYGVRYSVVSDQDETLIAVLRFLVNTINYESNYDAIVNLIGGLIGGADDSISGIVSQVLGMLQGDADEVIANLVDLLQTLAG